MTPHNTPPRSPAPSSPAATGRARLAAAGALLVAGCAAAAAADGPAAAPLVSVAVGAVLLQPPPSLRLPWHRTRERSEDPATAYPPFYWQWVLTTADPGASPQELAARADQHLDWWQHRNRQTYRSLDSVETDLDPQRLPGIIARHEAAHALIAHTLGATVLELTYSPHGGACRAIWTQDQTQPDRLWDMLTYALAGVVSDQRDGAFNTGSQLDMDQLQHHALSIISLGRSPAGHDGPLTVDALVSSARQRAVHLLDTNRNDHEALAEALLHDGPALSGAQVAALLGPPQTPPRPSPLGA